MRRTTAFLISALALMFASTASSASAADPAGKTPTKAELEKQFADSLTGSTMIGHYVIGDVQKGKDLAEDRYDLVKVSKMQGDTWLFNARIQVEGQDLTLPVPLKVLWAGDTPVITLDAVTIPGMGTFSSRILIDGHRYAGTWSHGNSGGVMFGRIEKTASGNKP